MARAITINGSETIIHYFVVSDAGFAPKTLVVSGRKSETAATKIVTTKFRGSALFSHVEYRESGSVSLDSDTFFGYARPCVDGVTYGHDTISREQEITYLNYATIEDGKPVTKIATYAGRSTRGKYLKALRDMENTQNVMLVGETTTTIRSFMPKALFERLANGDFPTLAEQDVMFAPWEVTENE